MRETSSEHKNNINIAIMMLHELFGGQKNEWILGFCGYGLDASSYEPFYELVKEKYNLVVIENPMHDYETDWSKDAYLNELTDLLNHFSIEQFSTISYSMGSRLNLVCYENYAHRMNRMILIAADGFQAWGWTRIATSSIGHVLFKFFALKKGIYHSALDLVRRLRLIPKELYVFSKWQMRDEVQRKRVYNAWMNLRCIRPNKRLLSVQHIKNKTKVISYFGKMDSIIPPKMFRRCRRIFPNGEHHLLSEDHLLFETELFVQIAERI